MLVKMIITVIRSLCETGGATCVLAPTVELDFIHYVTAFINKGTMHGK